MADSQAASASQSSVFVGRRIEMELLVHGVEDTLAGRGRMFLLTGEPGIGKTRLANELCRVAEARGLRILWGRCWEGGGAPPYWPLTQILRSYGRGMDPAILTQRLGASLEDMATLVPEWASSLGSSAHNVAGFDPDQARFRLFDSVSTFLRNAAAEQPLLLVFDDLHWADDASLLLLRFLGRDLRTTPLLVIGTYRDAEARLRNSTAGLLGQLGRESQGVPLVGLSEAAVGEYIAATTTTVAQEVVATAVHRATEGNPLFVDEVVALLRSQGRLDASATLVLQHCSVPEGVREVIRTRLQLVDAPTRTLLGIAAVIGREFDLRTVAAVVRRRGEGSAEAVPDIIASAETLAVIGTVADVLGRYRFVHTLVRETLYEDLSPTLRGELHHLVGCALESQYGIESAELAHHFLRGGDADDPTRAVRYSRAAAEAALSSLAYETAVTQFEAALRTQRAHPDGDTDDGLELTLLLALGGAQWRAADPKAATRSLLEATDQARRVQKHEMFATAVLALGLIRFERGRSDDLLVRLLEESLELLDDHDSALRARVMARFAQSFYLRGAGDRARAMAQGAVEMSRRLMDDTALAAALLAQHGLLWHAESGDERLAIATEIARLAQRSGDDELGFEALDWRVYDLFELGERHRADDAVDEYERLARTLRHPRSQWYTTVLRAQQAYLAGRFDEAEERAAAGLQVRQAEGAPLSQFYGAQLYTIRRDQGRLVELGPAMQLYAEQYPELGVWQCAAALRDADTGNHAAAQQHLDRLAIDNFTDLRQDVNWLTTTSILAEVSALVGDQKRAALLYEMMLPSAARHVFSVGCSAYRGPVPLFLGLLAHTAREWAASTAHFETALQMIQKMRAVPTLVRAQFELARMLHAAGGNEERAREVFAGARKFAAEIGMRQIVTSIDALVSETELAPQTQAPREGLPTAEFRREQASWVLSWMGSVLRLSDTKGLHCLYYLLSHAGHEISAVELQNHASDAAELDDATDGARADAAERARVNVTRLVNNALKRIESDSPELARHLRGAIKTGKVCTYRENPLRPVTWRL